MIPKNEIIAAQIANRCCRRCFQDTGNIQSIMEECCKTLQITVPNLICCETMAKNFSAFYLRKEPYLIYDSCLTESLFLYDNILDTKVKSEDIEKFFYKLIGEELIRNGDYLHCMYFSGKYSKLEYSFEKQITPTHILNQLSCQNYFLLAHELAHLSLHGKGYIEIPDKYKQFLNISFRRLSEYSRKGRDEKDFLVDRYYYFLDKCPENLDTYYSMLPQSNRYRHFVEECYCDFRGIQLLLENYAGEIDSAYAISNVLNYLITQEFIRNDLKDGLLDIANHHKDATLSVYLSALRLQMLLITMQFNHLTYVSETLQEIQSCFSLTDYWNEFIQKLPLAESFAQLSDKNIPNIDKKLLIDTLIERFYYCHFN